MSQVTVVLCERFWLVKLVGTARAGHFLFLTSFYQQTVVYYRGTVARPLSFMLMTCSSVFVLFIFYLPTYELFSHKNNQQIAVVNVVVMVIASFSLARVVCV